MAVDNDRDLHGAHGARHGHRGRRAHRAALLPVSARARPLGRREAPPRRDAHRHHRDQAVRAFDYALTYECCTSRSGPLARLSAN